VKLATALTEFVENEFDFDERVDSRAPISSTADDDDTEGLLVSTFAPVLIVCFLRTLDAKKYKQITVAPAPELFQPGRPTIEGERSRDL